MAKKFNAEEAKLQSKCVLWLWNTHPETRGLFFAVENEGARLSPMLIGREMSAILSNLSNHKLISTIARKILSMCKMGNAIAGAQSKAMGVTPGVSDCLFMWNDTIYCFEFKTKKGTQSEKQIWWESVVVSNNYNYYIIRDYDFFTKLINIIINSK